MSSSDSDSGATRSSVGKGSTISQFHLLYSLQCGQQRGIATTFPSFLLDRARLAGSVQDSQLSRHCRKYGTEAMR